MGFDELKNKAMDLAKEHSEQVGQGIDKAREFVDQKTGGQHSEQIQQGADKLKQAFGGEQQQGGDQQPNGQ